MSLGLNAALYMGARSLINQRIGIEIAGHNISNINTPNAARQRVDIRTDITLPMEIGEQGTGSVIYQIRALRDKLLDDQVITQQSLNGLYEEKENLMRLLQDALGEGLGTADSSATEGIQPTTGIQASLNEFFDSWQALEADPDSTIIRNDILSKTDILINDITSTYDRLLELKGGFFTQANTITDQINTYAEQIADLNNSIAQVEIATGNQANDLRDQRHELVEQLSKLANITVTDHTSGDDSMIDIALTDDTTAVLVNGAYGAGAGSGSDASYRLDDVSVNPLTGNVDTSNAYNRTTNSALRIVYTNATSEPTFTGGAAIPGGSTVVTVTEGELGATLDVSNNEIGANHEPPASGGSITTPTDSLVYKLNSFASNLVSLVNTAHTTNGWDQTGTAAVNFFTAGTNADDISLGAGITGPELIAAAQGATFPGVLNGENARAIADLRDNANLGEYYREAVTDFGTEVQKIERNNKSQQLIYDQIIRQRNSVSGISMDEEMTNLITFQRAFEASARFITVLNEMYQQLISMTR